SGRGYSGCQRNGLMQHHRVAARGRCRALIRKACTKPLHANCGGRPQVREAADALDWCSVHLRKCARREISMELCPVFICPKGALGTKICSSTAPRWSSFPGAVLLRRFWAWMLPDWTDAA